MTYAVQNVPYGIVGMELKLAVGFNTAKVKSIITLFSHQTGTLPKFNLSTFYFLTIPPNIMTTNFSSHTQLEVTCKICKNLGQKGPFFEHEIRFLQNWNLACKIFKILARFASKNLVNILQQNDLFRTNMQDLYKIRFSSKVGWAPTTSALFTRTTTL